eukprot:744809-Amphidinium_carterae.3
MANQTTQVTVLDDDENEDFNDAKLPPDLGGPDRMRNVYTGEGMRAYMEQGDRIQIEPPPNVQLPLPQQLPRVRSPRGAHDEADGSHHAGRYLEQHTGRPALLPPIVAGRQLQQRQVAQHGCAYGQHGGTDGKVGREIVRKDGRFTTGSG